MNGNVGTGLALIVVAGAPDAERSIARVVRTLPRSLAVPVVLIALGPLGDAGRLDAIVIPSSRLPVNDVEDQDPLVPGTVHVGPSAYHLLVERGHLALAVDDPLATARPSIDVLFESAAEAYGDRVLAIVLGTPTGDGADGLAAVRAHGGRALEERTVGLAEIVRVVAALGADGVEVA